MSFYLSELNNRLVPHFGSLVTHHINHSSGYIGKTELSVVSLQLVVVVLVIDKARNGIKGVAGLSLAVAVLILLDIPGLLVHLVHLVCVAVVSGDKRRTVKLVDNVENSLKLNINSLNTDTGRCHIAGVTYHIAVGEVYSEITVLAASESLDKLIGDLRGLHPGSLLKGYYVRGDFLVGLKSFVKFTALVTVPEVGNVSVFLSLGDSVFGNTGSTEILAHGVGDLGRRYQILRGNVKVSVILKHTCVNNLGVSYAVELVKFNVVKCLGYLNSSVAAEVVENNAVAVIDGTCGLAVLLDNEGRKILVDDLSLAAVSVYSLFSGCKRRPSPRTWVFQPSSTMLQSAS